MSRLRAALLGTHSGGWRVYLSECWKRGFHGGLRCLYRTNSQGEECWVRKASVKNRVRRTQTKYLLLLFSQTVFVGEAQATIFFRLEPSEPFNMKA